MRPADGDAGTMDVAKRLGVARLYNRIDVYPRLVGVFRELVRKADVDVTVGCLGELGEFGGLGRAEVPDAIGTGQVVPLMDWSTWL